MLDPGTIVGVTSLTIQVFSGLNKLRQFIVDANGATKDVDELENYLGTTRQVLESLQKLPGDPSDPNQASIEEPLKGCRNSLEELNAIIERLITKCEEGKSKQILKSIKAAWKKEDIEVCRRRLDRNLEPLSLALK